MARELTGAKVFAVTATAFGVITSFLPSRR
jgi:hypothetical protein